MAGLTHAVKASMRGKELTYRLGDGALTWSDGSEELQLPYSDIDTISLSKYSTGRGDQGQCTIKSRTGVKLKIRSHHFVSIGLFEDRFSTYGPFVQDLCAKTYSKNPGTSFNAGSTAMWYVWVVLLVLMVAIAALWIMALLGGAEMGPNVVVPLVMMAVLAPIAWRVIRRGKGAKFDPANPPTELLGP